MQVYPRSGLSAGGLGGAGGMARLLSGKRAEKVLLLLYESCLCRVLVPSLRTSGLRSWITFEPCSVRASSTRRSSSVLLRSISRLKAPSWMVSSAGPADPGKKRLVQVESLQNKLLEDLLKRVEVLEKEGGSFYDIGSKKRCLSSLRSSRTGFLGRAVRGFSVTRARIQVCVLWPFMLAFRRWLREFTEFFAEGNALNLAIAVVVGTQFQ